MAAVSARRGLGRLGTCVLVGIPLSPLLHMLVGLFFLFFFLGIFSPLGIFFLHPWAYVRLERGSLASNPFYQSLNSVLALETRAEGGRKRRSFTDRLIDTAILILAH